MKLSYMEGKETMCLLILSEHTLLSVATVLFATFFSASRVAVMQTLIAATCSFCDLLEIFQVRLIPHLCNKVLLVLEKRDCAGYYADFNLQPDNYASYGYEGPQLFSVLIAE